MSTAQLRARAISALTPAGFIFCAQGRAFDCPCCGSRGDLLVTLRDNRDPGYLLGFGNFCGCEQQQVVDEMVRLTRARRRR